MSPQVRKIVTWLITGMLALMMLVGGGFTIFVTPDAAQPNYFGVYSDATWVPKLIGALEVIAALAIVFLPKLRIPAILGLMILMLPALYAHYILDGNFSNAGGAVMVFVLAGLSMFLWKNYFLVNDPTA